MSFFEKFFLKKQAVLDTGLDFINCAELHLNPNNIENYWGEKMYIARHGYISPIWSRELTLRLWQPQQKRNGIWLYMIALMIPSLPEI